MTMNGSALYYVSKKYFSLVLVGGPNKADNLKRVESDSKLLKRIANSWGVKAQAYYSNNTPQSVLDEAAKVLDAENVKTFNDVTPEDFSELPQMKIIKNNINFDL